MTLDRVFHWAPAERREKIRREGLQPYDPAVKWAMGCGCVCCGFTPAAAWSLSGAIDRFTEEDVAWDLWEVTLAPQDEIRIRSEFGPSLQEVRVFNPIPADRLWWAGKRS